MTTSKRRGKRGERRAHLDSTRPSSNGGPISRRRCKRRAHLVDGLTPMPVSSTLIGVTAIHTGPDDDADDDDDTVTPCSLAHGAQCRQHRVWPNGQPVLLTTLGTRRGLILLSSWTYGTRQLTCSRRPRCPVHRSPRFTTGVAVFCVHPWSGQVGVHLHLQRVRCTRVRVWYWCARPTPDPCHALHALHPVVFKLFNSYITFCCTQLSHIDSTL
jgi:hypothetical protein